MELKYIEKADYKQYLNFVKDMYKDNPLCRDSMSSLLKSILLGKSEICKSTETWPYMVYKNGKPIMACVFALVDRMNDVLQISFFEEIIEDHNAFNLIMEKAKAIAEERKIHQISAGLNIHVNYGLGFLDSHYDTLQSFGMAYNNEFYHSFFNENGFKSIDLVSYKQSMNEFEIPLSERFIRRIRMQYTVRKAEFKHIEREARIYTEINNNAFSDHLFYFQRKNEEDLELFNDFKHLLREENLLFVEKDGVPVGFMLWYPDYHELMSQRETIGLKTVFWNRCFHKKIKKFKIVEMGVLKSEQKKGAIVALFDNLRQIVGNRYETCESGWILKDNKDSSNFGIKWGDSEYKTYKAYIKDLSHDDKAKLQ